MQTLLCLFSIIILCQSATVPVVPRIDSSSVNVHQSGPEFSYTIRENHEVGVGVEPIHLPPLVKIIPHDTNAVHQQQHQSIHHGEQQKQETAVRDHQIQPIEPQISPGQLRQEIHLPLATVTVPAILPGYQYTYPVGINYPYNLIASF